jgi:hypothetical protein
MSRSEAREKGNIKGIRDIMSGDRDVRTGIKNFMSKNEEHHV